MGQKTHPFGFRLGYNKSWLSLWYGRGQHYIDQFHTDIRIRKMVKDKYKHAGIASIEVKRIADTIRVQINTARPGILIGKGGAGIQDLKKFISSITSGPSWRLSRVYTRTAGCLPLPSTIRSM